MLISPSLNPEILRAYDIRGTYGKNLTDTDAFALGLRFAQTLQDAHKKTVSVCCDGRLSSPALKEHLVRGLIQGGCDVTDIGVGPTPLLYFSIKHLLTDAGIMVTGSHNPPEDNGFKIALQERPFFGEDIQALLDKTEITPTQPGTYQTQTLEEAYIDRLLQDYVPGHQPLTIAIDPGNGAAGHVVDLIKERAVINGRFLTINTAIDGTFPAHHPDPTVPENLVQLRALVQQEHCDLGIAFDGDADRIGVIDSKGRILWGDQLMILWSKDLLAQHPGAKIIADVKASDVLFEAIAAYGGNPIMARTGHSLIKTEIAKTGALLAGEMSGHIFFADHYYGFDDALYAMIRLLNILHKSDKTLTSLFDEIPKRINTPELRIYCGDDRKFAVVEAVKDRLIADGATFNDVDGVRVITESGWWLLRASNTQPIVVARCESESEEGLCKLKANLKMYLESCNVSTETV